MCDRPFLLINNMRGIAFGPQSTHRLKTLFALPVLMDLTWHCNCIFKVYKVDDFSAALNPFQSADPLAFDIPRQYSLCQAVMHLTQKLYIYIKYVIYIYIICYTWHMAYDIPWLILCAKLSCIWHKSCAYILYIYGKAENLWDACLIF